MTAPLAVEISATEVDAISLAQLEARFEIIGREFYLKTGVPFPGAKAWFAAQLPEATFRILIYDVPLYTSRLFFIILT